MLFMGILGMGFFGFLFAVLIIAFLIWAIVDIVKRPWKNDTNKVIWLLIVILLGLVGIVVYAILRKTEYVELIRKNDKENPPWAPPDKKE